MEHNLFTKKKVVLFVCHVENWTLFPNHDSSCNVFDIIGKLSISMGVISLIHNILAYGGKMIEYWAIVSIKIHLKKCIEKNMYKKNVYQCKLN